MKRPTKVVAWFQNSFNIKIKQKLTAWIYIGILEETYCLFFFGHDRMYYVKAAKFGLVLFLEAEGHGQFEEAANLGLIRNQAFY